MYQHTELIIVNIVMNSLSFHLRNKTVQIKLKAPRSPPQLQSRLRTLPGSSEETTSMDLVCILPESFVILLHIHMCVFVYNIYAYVYI